MTEPGQRKLAVGMIHIVIAEDDARDRQTLQEYVEKYACENHVQIRTDVYQNGETLLFHYSPGVDILLLDIEMPKLDGMATARKIRERDKDVVILFITNMAQYALEGYQVRARSYLLKPVQYISFAMELEEAIAMSASRKSETMTIRTDSGLLRLSLNEIFYIESQRHYQVLHTSQGELRMRETMKAVEERLQPYHFAKSSMSFLVNLAHVSAVNRDSVTVGGASVPVSRQKRREFLDALNRYIGIL